MCLGECNSSVWGDVQRTQLSCSDRSGSWKSSSPLWQSTAWNRRRMGLSNVQHWWIAQTKPLTRWVKLIINPNIPVYCSLLPWQQVAQQDCGFYGLLFRWFITTAMAVCVCVTMHFLHGSKTGKGPVKQLEHSLKESDLWWWSVVQYCQ